MTIEENRELFLLMLKRYGLLIGLFCVAALLFYWYDYRPKQIRRECIALAESAAIQMMKRRARMNPLMYDVTAADNGFFLAADRDDLYKNCLRMNGMETSTEK